MTFFLYLSYFLSACHPQQRSTIWAFVERAAQLFLKYMGTILGPQGPRHTNNFVISPLTVASDLSGALQRICVRGHTNLRSYVERYL